MDRLKNLQVLSRGAERPLHVELCCAARAKLTQPAVKDTAWALNLLRIWLQPDCVAVGALVWTMMGALVWNIAAALVWGLGYRSSFTRQNENQVGTRTYFVQTNAASSCLDCHRAGPIRRASVMQIRPAYCAAIPAAGRGVSDGARWLSWFGILNFHSNQGQKSDLLLQHPASARDSGRHWRRSAPVGGATDALPRGWFGKSILAATA